MYMDKNNQASRHPSFNLRPARLYLHLKIPTVHVGQTKKLDRAVLLAPSNCFGLQHTSALLEKHRHVL